MNLSSLDKRFRVLATEAPASADAILALRGRFPGVPEEYVQLVLGATELELDLAGKYLRVWHPDGCSEMDEAYGIRERMPGAVPVGDDGGGRLVMYFTGDKGAGLYCVGHGDLDPADAKWIAQSLTQLLISGVGVENL